VSDFIDVAFTFVIAPPLRTVEGEGPFSFSWSSPEGTPVNLTVSPDGKSLRSEARFSIAEATARALAAPNVRPASIEAQTTPHVSVLSETAQNFLRILMQEIGADMEHRLFSTIDSIQWRLNGAQWITAKNTVKSVSIRTGHPYGTLGKKTAGRLQLVGTLGEQPFLAFEFLREAYRSPDNRFAWIQAAAAAELGVKEALLRLEPRLDPLLLEVPAPPVEKLYGQLLEYYGGEKSPFKSDLQRGAIRRNRIIHRPRSEIIPDDERNAYLENVKKALQHLVERCRRQPVLARPRARDEDK
jgi:hypothetical protein